MPGSQGGGRQGEGKRPEPREGWAELGRAGLGWAGLVGAGGARRRHLSPEVGKKDPSSRPGDEVAALRGVEAAGEGMGLRGSAGVPLWEGKRGGGREGAKGDCDSLPRTPLPV